MKSFSKSVYRAVSKVSRGKVTTYGAIAKAIGYPKAVRAVGTALNKNPNLIKIPCHRVIRSDGFIGGYAKGLRRKIKLLRKEGVEVKNKKVDLVKFGCNLL